MKAKARFRQTLHGNTYQKGDEYEGMTIDQQDEAVSMGLGYYDEDRMTKSDIYRQLQSRGVDVDWSTPVEIMRQLDDES